MYKLSWEWVAGFFEGEGNVFWQEGKAGTKQGLHGRATMGQKDKAALQAIYDFLIEQGFSKPSFYLRPKVKNGKSAERSIEVWILTINRRDDVIRFYSAITPYLFEKKAEAEYVLQRLTAARDERDRILREAAELRKARLSWIEISRRLGVGRVSLKNYMESAGMPIDKRDYDVDWRQDRVNRGLCEACGKDRGKDGTVRKCRSCADKYNKRRAEHRRLYGRRD